MRISDWSSDVCSSDLFDPLHLALMDDGEKLVLDVRPASADLVKNNRACAPYCRWRLDVLQAPVPSRHREGTRSEEHTSELQSLMRISYAVFCLKNKNNRHTIHNYQQKI